MLPAVVAPTAKVVTVNVALELPAATVTEAGTFAARLLLTIDITAPPAGAGPVNETVAVDELPAGTLAGLRENPDRAIAGVTTSGNVRVTEL
jgi:hypothetical protein